MVEHCLRYRDDEPVGDPAVTVDAFAVQGNATAVRLDGGSVLIERPVYAGKAVETLRTIGPVAVASIRPNYGPRADGSGRRRARAAAPTGAYRADRDQLPELRRRARLLGGADPA